MAQERPEIKFKYIFNYNYNPIYINGAHGGISPRGELIMNFYLERLPLPDSITHEINQNGTMGGEVEMEPEDLKNSMVRFVETGVVMNYQNARDLHAWIGERLKEMEAVEQAKATKKQ
jgi:hypothetical protein